MKRLQKCLAAAMLLAAAAAALCALPVQAREEGARDAAPDALHTVCLAEYDGTAAACDTLLLHLDEELNVTDAEGKVLAPLAEFETDAVPAYYIKDSAAADAFAQYAQQNGFLDGIVVSDTPALVARVRQANTAGSRLSGMIDFRGKQPTVAQVQQSVNANMAKTALFDLSALTADYVRTLQKLLINVWADAASKEETYRALSYGCTGLLSRELPLSEAVKEADFSVLSPRPVLVAHRGCSEGAGKENLENTVAAARLAFERGAEAVEIDVHLTADGQLIVMHNDTLEGTTDGRGYIEQLALQDIRRYKVNGTEEIPLLTDYFEEFCDEDLFFFIEIKTSKSEAAQKLQEAIEGYGMMQKCSVISFNGAQLDACRQRMPELSVGYLDGSVVCADESEESVARYTQQAMAKLCPVNASYHADFNGLTESGIRALAARGIPTHVYTLNLSQNLFSYYAQQGAASVTTDYAVWLRDYAKSIRSVSCELSQTPARVTAECETFGGGTKQYTAKLIVLESDGEILQNANGYYAEGACSGRAVALIDCYDENYQLQFTLLSEPFAFEAADAEGLAPVFIALIAVAAAAAAACAGLFVLRAVRKKKQTKNSQNEVK